jgi:hypothetical protein
MNKTSKICAKKKLKSEEKEDRTWRKLTLDQSPKASENINSINTEGRMFQIKRIAKAMRWSLNMT